MLGEFWGGLDPQIKAALIGAVAAVGTATLGALAVILQIGRHARHAIAQNRHNEALKLKLHVYEEILAVCRDVSNANTDLSSYVRRFQMDLTAFCQMRQSGLSWSIPKARVPVLMEKSKAFGDKTIEIVSLTERWQIIDPRVEIFRTAINAAKYDVDAAFWSYFDAALHIMPQEIPDHPQQGTLFPWHPPSEQTAREFEKLGDDLMEALWDVGMYVYDFQVEMQNLLVGELFGHNVPPRRPRDPKYVSVQLDRFEELTAYFNKETAWGRNMARIESEARVDDATARAPADTRRSK